MKTAVAILVAALTGCTSNSVLREHEVEANLPRAQGLGAFATSCIMFCFPRAYFTHGDDTIDPNATAALMRSKLVFEQDQTIKPPSAGIHKRPKPPPKGTPP